jgi:hypothetical protein
MTLASTPYAGAQVSGCHPVINEVLVGTTGNPTEEFIELFNPCPSSFTLDGWRLVYRSAGNNTSVGDSDDAVLYLLEGPMMPGVYRVYGGLGYPLFGPMEGPLMRNIPEVPGAVGLRDRNAYLTDSVLWGAVPTGSAFMEGGMAAPAPVLASSPGLSLSRVPNGGDTNNNGRDFKVTPPTPTAATTNYSPGAKTVLPGGKKGSKN